MPPYAPILFPTCEYGPTGDVIVVQNATQLAALPGTYGMSPTEPPVVPTVTIINGTHGQPTRQVTRKKQGDK